MNHPAAAQDESWILSELDLFRITGKHHRDAQCTALRRLGIKFGTGLDGHPVVTRDAVRAYTGEAAANGEARVTLNLDALDAPKARAR